MNREIKFRAWDGVNNTMINTALLLPQDNQPVVLTDVCINDEIPLTWMQYTGLKDKNGKEIYEGDIVKGTYSKLINYMRQRSIDVKGVVEFNNTAQFAIFTRLTNNGIKEYKFFNQFWPLSPDSYEIEVIGNIYENPELLQTDNYKLKEGK